ncbi:flagellar hook-associated protein FlgK [Clostridium tunisiense]|uniref:flagellar hook-associated protein FlgK n=1 Tax=Clostridium tunisiense TaxID=219748 RepID=UPI00030D66A9|nr:flagellar hook-associated protein FlgK [Clostridium tunisiense]
MSGLFATLNTSKGAMYTQQQSINITSHNIANAGTPGYSRQHGVQQTARPQTVVGAGQVGTGVVMNEIQRARNIFLDFQIRKESSSIGKYQVREQYLTEIEGVFNEPSTTGLSKLLSEFFDGWQSLSTNTEKSDARTIVAEKAKTLANELNHTYTNLSKISENSKSQIQQSIFDINNIFDQLNSLNEEIKTVTVAGNNPNDLMDRRDLLLDQLSTKFGISTKNENYNSMTLKPDGIEGINLINTDGRTEVKKLAFVNDVKELKQTIGGKEESYSPKKYEITYYKNGDMTSETNKNTLIVETDDATLINNIKESRTLWVNQDGSVPSKIGDEIIEVTSNGNGREISIEDLNLLVFKPNTGELGGVLSIYKDIDGYKSQLDSLAKSIAYSVNAVHMEGYGADSIPFFVGKDNPLDYNNISAGNIKINEEIIKDPMKIQTGLSKDSGKTDGKRALAIAQLRDLAMNIQDITEGTTYDAFKTSEFNLPVGIGIAEGKNLSTGMKIEGFYKNSINKLGIQSQESQRIVKNQETLLEGLLTRRASVSGVSMDEEMVNLVQFQHAYQANAKMISTVDELLDVVINGLKR